EPEEVLQEVKTYFEKQFRKCKTLTQEALPIYWRRQYNSRQDIEKTRFANMANM
ncbi:4893_t:CDS:1, partial [Gigaspora rosea]